MIGRTFSAMAFLSVGVCLGIVVGSIFDGPRIFVRRLTEPIQRVEVGSRAPGRESEQANRPGKLRSSPPVSRASRLAMPGSRSGGKGPAGDLRPETLGRSGAPLAPVAAPSRRAVPHTPEQRAAERVIAAIRAQGQETQTEEPAKVVQVAAYTDRRAADALARRLGGEGFDCYVSRTRHEGRERYRVRVRPGMEASVESLVSRLERQGLNVWVTRE